MGSCLAHGLILPLCLCTVPTSSRGTEACDSLRDLRICSHRGLGAEDAKPQSLLQAMEHLIAEGIFCFDMDVVATSDGHHIVGHPTSIADAAHLASTSAMKLIEGHKLTELRAMGADSLRFPEIKTLAWKLGEALEQQWEEKQPSSSSSNATHSYPLDRFVLALEPKGMLAHNDTLAESFASEVHRLMPRLSPPVLWRTTSKRAPPAGFPWMLALRSATTDVRPKHADALASAAAKEAMSNGFSALGAAIQLGEEAVAEMKRSGLPILVFGVEDSHTFTNAVHSGATAAVSNVPLKMNHERLSRLSQCEPAAATTTSTTTSETPVLSDASERCHDDDAACKERQDRTEALASMLKSAETERTYRQNHGLSPDADSDIHIEHIRAALDRNERATEL